MKEIKAVVSVIGKDDVGILAKVSAAVAEAGACVADMTQSVLDGYFCMIMIIEISKATREVEIARRRLDEVMKERKTHEKLREKAFEEFKKELLAEESKETDQLVSFTYHKKS